jgi:hypothetical protein
MKARRSTTPTKIPQFHHRALEITLEMLKMKVDPAICMKIKARRQNVHTFQAVFCRKMRVFAITGTNSVHLCKKIGVVFVERPGNQSLRRTPGRGPSLRRRGVARRAGPMIELRRDTPPQRTIEDSKFKIQDRPMTQCLEGAVLNHPSSIANHKSTDHPISRWPDAF